MRTPARLLLATGLLAAAACSPQTEPPPETPRTTGRVERLDARLDELVPPGAVFEILAEGFEWAEGPVWRKTEGYLLFTDIPKNTIYQWSGNRGLQVFLRPSGYTGSDPPGDELGANGLAFAPDGHLVLCDHGNRVVARLDETNYTRVTLAGGYEGRRFNSPNDLVFHSGGDLYFTDPPFGLRHQDADPAKELPFNGVYRLRPDGTLSLLIEDLTRPNGIALSPDERTLYVSNADPERPVWMAYNLRPDGTPEQGRVFFDGTALVRAGKPGLPDGMALDRAGNLFATGPGGVLVFSPDGTHLGTLETGRPTANVAFGEDGSTLFATADDTLLRMRLTTRGLGF
ncbi:SMP-30/gluconolactonase/LRE family protein [Rhodocaloribacter litoris]|uniref:SMP-30/gluconolactonase/LRE family protein n=1 Tax=Rhodocaloribacter litoris TaxID=2558931 RepID=UPI0014205983|nr:SMP-30/gluconolactonase/LRE family protein [Rhodocaloribacter litoris]QXD16234.1 SMP-30/gluconolactonase/LRE family protein [Rhodocaloribacter litoris]GIV60729.1 MAG: gluconolactonase [Rhodothermaceae bacterium]